MSKNDPALTADLSSDCDYLACGVASGGEAWGGSAPSDLYFGAKAPAGREGRWIKTVPWQKLSEMG